MRLTKDGLDEAPEPDLAKTLVDSVREVLTGPQAAIFEELLQRGAPIGWEPAGSNLRNRLSELSALELVDYPGRGVVALQEWVTN